MKDFRGNPLNKKNRRHSGYRIPNATVSKKDIIKYDLFIDPFYDDWRDYRDGLRDWISDFKKIKRFVPRWVSEEFRIKRIRMNTKQKYLLRRGVKNKNHPRRKKSWTAEFL